MSKDNGGSAFPHLQYGQNGSIVPMSSGMTLRDYFAGQAVCGNIGKYEDDAMLAEYAYAVADAMLAQRQKEEGR